MSAQGFTEASRVPSVRETELRCWRCKEWKPDDEFPSNRPLTHRRGRHSNCRACHNDLARVSNERARERAAAEAARKAHEAEAERYAMRRWWLDRYSLDEIREMAGALWNVSAPQRKGNA